MPICHAARLVRHTHTQLAANHQKTRSLHHLLWRLHLICSAGGAEQPAEAGAGRGRSTRQRQPRGQHRRGRSRFGESGGGGAVEDVKLHIFRPRATTCDTMWQLAAHANTRLMHQRHCVPCTTGWKWGDGRTARLRPTPNVFRALALPLLRLSSAFWEGRGGWRHRSRSGAPAFLVHPL